MPTQTKKQTRSLGTLKHVWTPDHHYVMRTIFHKGFTRAMFTTKQRCSSKSSMLICAVKTVYAGFAAVKKEKGFLFSFQIPENTQRVQKKLTWPAKS